MTKEQQVDYLLHLLLTENSGYASIPEPVNYAEKRKLLRSLMNVRFPGAIMPEALKVQDELLRVEQEEQKVVDAALLPPVSQCYPCAEIKNPARIFLWQGDITILKTDAIVNAANGQMLGCFVPCHGCIDNAIHSAAGMQLRNECAEIMASQGHEEPVGKAKITKGYNLPARHVIHTVGPVVGAQVTKTHEKQLEACYLSCLKLAEKNDLDAIAFCCISTGEFHFPNKAAAEIAVKTIDRYLSASRLNQVIINVYKNEDLNIYQKMFR